MAEFVLALDQGTTSSRAIVFDSDGHVVRVAQREFPQRYPQPGWIEHDPDEIWESQIATALQVIEESAVSPDDIAAIGIANQRETTLLWDRKTGQPVYNAIVWQDRRTAPLCEQLRAEGIEELLRRKTGLVLDPYFSATKLRWLLDNVDGARTCAERGELAFGTVDSFLLWRLTGIHATDVSNASRTLLFNIHTLDWDEELLGIFGIPRAILPDVKPSSHVYGPVRPEVIGVECPVSGIAGDQQAAAFGQACFQPGMVKNTYGTGSFLLMNTGAEPRESRHRLLTTIAWLLQRRPSMPSVTLAPPFPEHQAGDMPTYALEGSVFATGAAIQWLRDDLGIIGTAAESEGLATSVSDSAGVYFIPAFTGMGAPYWDSGARAAILGLTRGAGRAHLARAALESACFQSRDVIEAMQADCGAVLTDLRVDGGMTANNLLLQMQADILGIPVHRPAVTETTALGAAYLAGLAIGVWSECDEIAGRWRIDRTFEPRMSADQRDSLYAGWKRAVARVLD